MLCGPLARVKFCGVQFAKHLCYVTVKLRVYTQSCTCSFEGFFGKVFGWEGFGSFGVFVPVTLKIGGLKVPSTFGIKDLL
jgi:hypothetical protein